MLKFFSRLEKTRNFVLLVFGILMVVSLVGFGITSVVTTDTRTNSVAGSGDTVAKVGSEKVTSGDINQQRQGPYGGRMPIKMLLNGLIGQRVIRIEANRLGLRASDAEVAAEIRKQLKQEDGTVLTQKQYEENIASSYGSVASYEQMIRDDLSGQKLQAFLTAGVSVSDAEVLKDYQRQNTKFDVNYVSVSVPDLAATIKPTDAELSEYFEKNKANYAIKDDQKKIKYVFLNTSKVGEKTPLSDEDLKAEYEKIPVERRTKGVEAQQIVFKVAKPEFKAQTLEKAQQVVERAKNGGTTATEEAFGDLAKGYSEDAVSKANNGKLSTLVRDNPNLKNTPNAVQPPQQTVLGMKEGEVSDPIEFGNAFYIFRRGKEVPKTFEDAKPELEVSLRNRKAYATTAELATKVVEDLKQTKDPAATAAKFAAQANMTAAEMVRETPYVKPGDNVENIGVSPQFEEGIKNLNAAGDVGERTPIQNGFAIPMLVDKKAPRDATLDEVKTQVAEAVKLEKARTQVEEIAKQIAAGATSAEGLSAAATTKGLKALDQKAYTVGSPLGQGPSAGTSEALEDAVYGLKVGEVTKTPLQVGDNWVVVGVTKREEANMDEFAKKRDELMQGMLQQRRGGVFSDYLASVRQKMETNGDIKVYKEVVDKLDAETKDDPTQMPFPLGQ